MSFLHQPIDICIKVFNPSGVETKIFQANYVNAMAADALAPCIARPSTCIMLTKQDRWVLVFNEKGFQQPVSIQYWEIIQAMEIYSYFTETNLGCQGLLLMHHQAKKRWDISLAALQWYHISIILPATPMFVEQLFEANNKGNTKTSHY